jgi:DNA-binding NtrC family response regulator
MLLCVHRSAHALATSEHYPRHEYGHPDAFGIAGESPAIARLRRTIGMVSKRSEHVLIHGASGTGKELVARAIHGLSPRAAHTMVCRNAATIPEGLIDAELFGNVKNYPHAGMAARPGLVGQAHASTLFLDEFAELPATMQSHLLRVLDSGEYQRLGDAGFARSDLRLIAATNRPLTMIKEDLLARFGLRIEVPSLNERREDVPWLIRHVLERLSSSDPELSARLFRGDDRRWEPMLETDFVRRLLRHDYRTNVRELQVILWASIEQSDGELSWPAGSMAAHPGIKTPEPAAGLDRAVTRERLQAALDRHNGRIEATWRELGLRNRYVLRRLITKYRLELRRRPS